MHSTIETDRVRRHTNSEIKARIDHRIETNVRTHGMTDADIDRRLHALDHEWDIERVLEMNASALAFTGVVAGAFVDKRWLALPALVTAFLFQHSTQGWCPPLPVFRRLGVRTRREIDVEKFALKVMRGDFDHVGSTVAERRAGPAIRAASS